jgi:hypothetical protein
MVHLLRTRSLLWRTAIAAVTVAAIAFAGWFGSVWYALDRFAACSNIVLSQTRSPDGSRAVFVFRQECNATVADSTWASVAPADRAFSPDREHAFLGVAGGIEVLPNWRGNDVVEIGTIPGGAPFLKREPQAGDVRVDYR